MKASNLVTVVFDFIELLLRWMVVWLMAFLAIGAAVTVILSKSDIFDAHSPVELAILITLYGVVAFAAMTDLALRIKGTKTLFARLRESRTANAISSAVDAGEKRVVSITARIAKLAGLLLLIALFGFAAYFLYQGVAALPISVAIVIGAVIIAIAITYK